MAIFQVYRLKVVRASQRHLFQPEIDRRTFVTELLQRKPSHELRSGYIWHIGNLQSVGDDGIIFAAGRTTSQVGNDLMRFPATS